MTVEQVDGSQFPSGLRVLVVDDDRACLRILETMLGQCQYNVTSTISSIMALRLLRENKNMFDLIISDVHMPDMDGFKLLELVGLEMDLPVIMMSSYGDHKLVMKGITHGACDYLLKPVRIEELRNIWQHVVRRKKVDPKDRNNSDNQDKTLLGSGEVAGMGNSDQNGKLNKKRKDQNEDDEERDENEHDDEDASSMQKKPRVVWSAELHNKFVAAVNQLGIDKAVPKKILDMMNVENLTRENVASHLQKFRIYLKRLSCEANQQANMVAALGSTDPSYYRMSSVNGLGNFHNLAGPVQFQNSAFRSLPPSGMLGRLNTPTVLGMRGLPSSGMIQLHHAQNSMSNSANGSILQGMPKSLELDQLQPIKSVTSSSELPTSDNNATVFPLSSGFQDARIIYGRPNNPLLGVADNPLMLGRGEMPLEPRGHPVEAQCSNIFGDQTSVTSVSLNSGLSHQPDLGRCNGNWSSAVQSSGIQPNSFPLGDCLKQPTLNPSNFRDNLSTMTLQVGNNLPFHNQLHDSEADLQFQSVPVNKNSGQIVMSNSLNSNIICNSLSSTIPIGGVVGLSGESLDPTNTMFHRSTEFDSLHIDPFPAKVNEAPRATMQTSFDLKEGFLMQQQKPQGSYNFNNLDSLEGFMSSMVKEAWRR